MQEHSYTLPMCSIGRTSHVTSTVGYNSNDTHSLSSSTNITNDIETTIESSTSTPELNLLLVINKMKINKYLCILSFFAF